MTDAPRGHGREAGAPRGRDPGGPEPVDPDVDLRLARQRAETRGRRRWPLLAAVACGGALGALARHGVTRVLPSGPDRFPWAVFTVNAAGCALIGVATVLLSELPPGGGRPRAALRHPLARPFLGVGLLGGFTTFSTYALGTARLLENDHPGAALAYLAATPVAALAAVAPAAWATRALVRRVPRRTSGERP
jgi:fluoride exporter